MMSHGFKPLQQVELKGMHFCDFFQDGYDSVTVRVKRSIKMKDLMKAYHERRSVGHNTYEFLLDGQRIQGEQTPDEVCIHVFACIHGVVLSQ